MAEPVTLYKGRQEMTVHSPSEAKRLMGEGWTLDKPAPEPVKPKPKGTAK